MPRSWRSTESGPTSRIGVEPTAASKPGAAMTEIEVIDLGPGQVDHPVETMGTRRGWMVAMIVAAMILGGPALLPEAEVAPETTATTVPSLVEPVVATTSTAVAAASVAIVSDETFPLIPVGELIGFEQMAGPVEFDGRNWIAGNRHRPTTAVTLLSSSDGVSWSLDGALTIGSEMWLRIDDLAVFDDTLVAVGTIGVEGGPSFVRSNAGTITVWTSQDGTEWSARAIAPDVGMENWNLTLTTSPEEILVTGYQTNLFHRAFLEAIPAELLPGLESGDLYLAYGRSEVKVVSPPGIEVLSIPVAQRTDLSGNVLFRSENVTSWERLMTGDLSTPQIASTFDGGFVSTTNYDQSLYSTDGRSWKPNDRFPSLSFQAWDDRMIAFDHQSNPNLVILDETGMIKIEFPDELHRQGTPLWLTPGATGLAATVADYPLTSAEPSAEIDGYRLEMDSGILRITEPSGADSYAVFGSDGLVDGSYVAETDSIRFNSTDGSRVFEFSLDGLQELVPNFQPIRFDIALSEDGLVWARSQTGLLADDVEIIGAVDDGFLIGQRSFAGNRQNPLTIYRTGPVG